MKPTQKDYDVAAWEVLSRQIMRRDGYRCQAACGCTEPLSVHHIIPRDVGGSDDPANLITLCHNCHNEIEQTAIRTAAEVRAYAPRWHATVSWYPTKRPGRTRNEQPKRSKRRVSHSAETPRPNPPKGPTPPKTTMATCTMCGKTYKSRTTSRRYCSPACAVDMSEVRSYLAHPEWADRPWAQRLLKIYFEQGAGSTAKTQEGVSHERDR